LDGYDHRTPFDELKSVCDLPGLDKRLTSIISGRQPKIMG